MKYRQLAIVFAILAVLLYLGYAFWGLSNGIVLALAIISAIAAVACIVMMFTGKKGSDRGASSKA